MFGCGDRHDKSATLDAQGAHQLAERRRRSRHVPAAVRAQFIRAMKDAVRFARRMGNVAARFDSWSSITSSRGRLAARRRSRICGFVAGPITSTRPDAISVRISWVTSSFA